MMLQELQKSSSPRAVVSWQWQVMVKGDRLYYRSGTAPATQPFRMIQLPAKAQKVALDSKQVYVWTHDLVKGDGVKEDLLAFLLGQSGPMQPATHLATNDAAALEALSNPPLSAKHAAAARPSSAVTLTPQRLLVANYGNDSVSAIDTSQNSVVGTLSLVTNAAPSAIVASPNNYQAFTANNSNPNCTTCSGYGETIFNPSTMTNSGFLTGHYPNTLTLSADASTLFVGDDEIDLTGLQFLRVYNTAAGTNGPTIALPASPTQSALSPDGNTLYVVSSNDGYYQYGVEPVDAVTTVNTTSMTPVNNTFSDGSTCEALAVQPTTGNVYVMCENTLLNTTPVIYITSLNSDGTMSLVSYFTIGDLSYGLAFSPDGTKLYVTLVNSSAVQVLDPTLGTILGNITVGASPTSITLNAGGTRGYVTNFGSNTVSVVDLTANSVIATVTVGTNPLAAALTFAGSTLSASPATLTFSGTVGSSPGTQNLTLNADQGGSFTAVAATTSGGNWLSISTASGSFPVTEQVSVNAGGLAVGTYQGTITVTSSGAANTPFTIPVTLTIASQAAGTVSAVVNGASFAANTPIAAGALVSIFGLNIGPGVGVGSSGVPLPTTLANISVTIGAKAAPLLFVSSGQINCQVPFEIAGQTTAPVVVTNTSTLTQTPATNVSLSASSPGIFTVVINGTTQGAILNQDFSFNTPANPAHHGDVVQIFATGQGAVANAPADGAIATGGTSTTPVTPVVLIGNQPAAVQFSGLAPGFVGLWQVNANVPAGAASGSAVSVQIVLNGAISNTTTLAVQ
jgi:uncharacterized protein (TIGR03437 family)